LEAKTPKPRPPECWKGQRRSWWMPHLYWRIT